MSENVVEEISSVDLCEGLTIGPCERAHSRLLVVVPSAFVLAIVREGEDALTLLFIV